MEISNKSFESILLNTKPISGPSKKSNNEAKSIISSFQKRERPFSAREYVETQKALLKAKQERNKLLLQEQNSFPNSSRENISKTNEKVTSDSNQKKNHLGPSMLRFDPFAEELERDNKQRDNLRKYLTVPPHLKVLSNKKNVPMKLDDQNPTGKPTVAPLSQISQYEHSPSIVKSQMIQSMKQYSTNPRMWVRSVLGATLDRGYYEIPKVELSADAASQMIEFDHAEYLEVFDQEHEDTYDDVSQDGLNSSKNRGSKQVRFRPISASTTGSEAYWEQMERGEDFGNVNSGMDDKYMYEDMDQSEYSSTFDDAPSIHSDSLKNNSIYTAKDYKSKINRETDSRRIININKDFNIVTRPYTSIPKIDPNIELLRVESQYERKHGFGDNSSVSSERSIHRTFFDTDSETADVESIHTGMDSDFMEFGRESPMLNQMNALRRESINTPTDHFDLGDSEYDIRQSIHQDKHSHNRYSSRNDSSFGLNNSGTKNNFEEFGFETNQHSNYSNQYSYESDELNTQDRIKSLETQFDDLSLGRDLEEVVASIFATPSNKDEISEQHKKWISTSLSQRQQLQEAEDNRRNMLEFEKMQKELELISSDPNYYRR